MTLLIEIKKINEFKRSLLREIKESDVIASLNSGNVRKALYAAISSASAKLNFSNDPEALNRLTGEYKDFIINNLNRLTDELKNSREPTVDANEIGIAAHLYKKIMIQMPQGNYPALYFIAKKTELLGSDLYSKLKKHLKDSGETVEENINGPAGTYFELAYECCRMYGMYRKGVATHPDAADLDLGDVNRVKANSIADLRLLYNKVNALYSIWSRHEKERLRRQKIKYTPEDVESGKDYLGEDSKFKLYAVHNVAAACELAKGKTLHGKR